eukprot:SAG22_NODE_8_length_37215_cov_120.960351_11_plen_242_part_00
MVYYCVGPGAFVAPWIIGKLGPQLSMGLGALTYTTYAAAIFLMEFGIGKAGQLMLPAGAGVGITCSTLWSAMGLYAKQQSRAYDKARRIDPQSKDGSLGSFNGITYAGVQAGSLSAMLGTSVLISVFGERRKLIFGGLLAVAALGNATLFCLPSTPKVAAAAAATAGATAGQEEEEEEEDKPKGVSIAAVPKFLARSGVGRWFVLCFLHNGFGTSFASGTFTADVAAKTLGSAWGACVRRL